jgi:transcriptional regulator with XRE-family HTH domain
MIALLRAIYTGFIHPVNRKNSMSEFSLWDRIEKAMRERGITKAQLARIANVSPGSVQKWEAGGNITLEPALRIGIALGMQPGELVKRSSKTDSEAERFLVEAHNHLLEKMTEEGVVKEITSLREPPPTYRTAPAAPPQPPCRFPVDCDLSRDLSQVQNQLATLSAQVDTLTRLLGATLAAGANGTAHHQKQKAG